jgi:ATP-dependent exoDNAse (exonuclease V) alpha subunit
MNLTEEQKFVIKELVKVRKPITVCAGLAGTGKTTIIKHVVQKLRNWAVASFTGKSADVLRKKGITATTIHSLIYHPIDQKDKNNNPIFAVAPSLPYNGIIIDEASMVSDKIYEDLISFGLPIIFFGDHGQLPPIASKFNIMTNPDYVLETIHRNSGEIAWFARWIRNGYNPSAFAHRYKCKKITFVSKLLMDHYLLEADQIICAFNKTRVQLNNRVRYYQGIKDQKPVIGDRIMCLRNYNDIGLFNGMQGTIKKIKKTKLHFETDGRVYDVRFDPSQFGKETYEIEDFNKDDPVPFDWCYAVTCHKSMGDEWPCVMVVEQRTGRFEFKRWAYTAASRAEERLIWVY